MDIQSTIQSIKYLYQIINTPLFMWCISTLHNRFRICNLLSTTEDIHRAGNSGPFNQFISLPFFGCYFVSFSFDVPFAFLVCFLIFVLSMFVKVFFFRHYEDDNYKHINIRF